MIRLSASSKDPDGSDGGSTLVTLSGIPVLGSVNVNLMVVPVSQAHSTATSAWPGIRMAVALRPT